MSTETVAPEIRSHWYRQLRQLTQQAILVDAIARTINAATPIGRPSLVPHAVRIERRAAWLRVNELAALVRETAPWREAP